MEDLRKKSWGEGVVFKIADYRINSKFLLTIKLFLITYYKFIISLLPYMFQLNFKLKLRNTLLIVFNLCQNEIKSINIRNR